MSRFHCLTIAEVRKETADAVSVAFEIPPELVETFRFVPGQYLTLRADIDGDSVRRPYSICSGIEDRRLRVGIKAVAGGRFSTFAQGLRAGDTLDVMPPQGHFRWLTADERSGDGPRHHLGFAAGSGITPILSILRSVLREHRQDTFTLCYGNRGQGAAMFLDELHDLKDEAMQRLRIMHVFSREQTEAEVQRGHIDGDRVRALVECGYFDPQAIDVVYACGPGAMNEKVRDALQELGVSPDKVRFERFTAAPKDARGERPPAPPPAATDADSGAQVDAIIDGLTRSLRIRPDENVIAAAERQGVDLPYSCAGGMCCTCRCKVVQGEVRMDVCYSLEKWELEAGFVLACQAHPTTERVVLDFDAR